MENDEFDNDEFDDEDEFVDRYDPGPLTVNTTERFRKRKSWIVTTGRSEGIIFQRIDGGFSPRSDSGPMPEFELADLKQIYLYYPRSDHSNLSYYTSREGNMALSGSGLDDIEINGERFWPTAGDEMSFYNINDYRRYLASEM